MRSSYWSSDVCSSDLWTLQAVDQLIAGDLDLTDHEVHSKVGFSVYAGYLIPFDDEASGVLVQSAHEVKHAADFLEAFVGNGQIGRASCRERVGQYVSIWVVAVSLKTKKRNSTK